MFAFEECYQEIVSLAHRYHKLTVQSKSMAEELAQYKKQKWDLLERFGKRYGDVRADEARKYTEQELMELRQQLAESAGIWALIRSLLGFGKSQKEAYCEMLGKINGLLEFISGRIRDSQGESAAILNKLYQLSLDYSLAYKSVRRYSGCGMETPPPEVGGRSHCSTENASRWSSAEDIDWTSYELPERLENEEIFPGDFLRPFMPENVQGELAPDDQRGILFRECREGGDLKVPWRVSLTAPCAICIDYKGDTAEDARAILRSLVYQMLRNIPQHYMEFYFMDAVTSGDDFRDFIRLQQVKKNDVVSLNRKVTEGNWQLGRTFLKSEDISAALTALVQRMTVVINEKAPFTTVTEYNEERGIDAWIPYQTVIAQNLHEGYSDKDLQNLQYLIENGRNLGVFVILLNNEERWGNESSYGKKPGLEGCFSQEALHNLIRIRMEQPVPSILTGDSRVRFRYWQTGGAHPEFIEAAVVALASEKKLDNDFQSIFDLNEPFGRMDSTGGLHIPFALTRRGEILSYTLGQALNAHGLICGGTGSGKSSLLHMLISSIVMNYTPEDVEIWLSDYKITEFYSYKTNTPPHIRFIGLSKTSDFSYAFLDKIVNEMNRRQNLIAQADHQYKLDGGKTNITSFTDYRKIKGRNSMTRLVVIIDEFHVMSQHAQLEPDYKTKLENILSEARALGIVLLLSDQAIVDGLRGLSDKGKKQIKARIALSNYMDELKETLNEKDVDKLRSFIHMNVGEVAIQTVKENEDKEEVAVTERATAIYINGACRYNVNEKAREFYGARDYVADVFDDRVVEPMKMDEIDQWENANLTVRRDGSRDLYIYLGRPVNLDFSLRFPLLQRKGNNMMCVSGTEEQQMRVLHAVVASFARQKDFAIRIMADPYAGLYREYEPEIRELGRTCPEISVHDELGDICYELNVLLGLLHDRGNRKKHLVVWLGLDAMADLLAEESKRKPASLAALSSPKQESARPAVNESTVAKPETGSIHDAALDAFNALFGEDDLFGSSDTDEITAAGDQNGALLTESGEASSELYDAREDIARLIHLGPTCNVFNLVIYDSASALRDFRDVKTSDFNHKIAFVMSEYEAGEFLDQPRTIRELAEHLGYYHNGRAGKRFIPYRL